MILGLDAREIQDGVTTGMGRALVVFLDATVQNGPDHGSPADIEASNTHRTVKRIGAEAHQVDAEFLDIHGHHPH